MGTVKGIVGAGITGLGYPDGIGLDIHSRVADGPGGMVGRAVTISLDPSDLRFILSTIAERWPNAVIAAGAAILKADDLAKRGPADAVAFARAKSGRPAGHTRSQVISTAVGVGFTPEEMGT